MKLTIDYSCHCNVHYENTEIDYTTPETAQVQKDYFLVSPGIVDMRGANHLKKYRRDIFE